MPELPEVETVVRGLRSLVGTKIADFWAEEKFQDACRGLQGRWIEQVSRHGKYIIFSLSGAWVISHLRMTGAWLLDAAPTHQEHVRFWFDAESPAGVRRRVTFVDPRKFGTFEFIASPGLAAHTGVSTLGYDGLLLGERHIVDSVVKRAFQTKASVKQFLLDQSIIAGCGNIYASCVLWRVGVDPRTPANLLPAPKVRELCQALYELFLEAIEAGGTSASDYVNTSGLPGSFQERLQVYGREGKPCARCQAPILRIAQAGRSTFFCPNCQVNYGNIV